MEKNHLLNYPIEVSVCVITYNQEPYIDACLESIMTQVTDFTFEVIISDDGSTDSTRQILLDYAKRYPNIRLVLPQSNVGPYRNFVETHNLALGKYVCHCDGDDHWLPGKLKKQYDFLEQNKDFSVVWTKMHLFDDTGRFLSGDTLDYSIFENGVVEFSKALRIGTPACHSSIMYRAVARKTRHAEFDVIDLFYTWEFLSQGKGKILNEVLGEYRCNSLNSLSRDSELKMRELNALYAHFYYKKFPEQRINIFYFSLFNFLADVKNKRKTAKLFFQLALKTFSLISPIKFYRHIKKLKNYGQGELSSSILLNRAASLKSGG